jgi:hypothetical protein
MSGYVIVAIIETITYVVCFIIAVRLDPRQFVAVFLFNNLRKDFQVLLHFLQNQ